MTTHQHLHDHSHSLGEQNRHHFDNVASSIFQEEWVQSLGKQVTSHLRENISWMGLRTDTDEPLTMLDYACGNGLVSRAVADYIPIIRGMDISSGMVTQYNEQASKAGHPSSAMQAVQGDIVDSAASPPQAPYDLIVISLALHHVQDPEGMIRKLVQHLKPGVGVLVAIDWIHPDESGSANWREQVAVSENPAKHTVTRAGFKEAEMERAFADAGLQGWKWKPFGEESVIPGFASQRAFMARGVRKL